MKEDVLIGWGFLIYVLFWVLSSIVFFAVLCVCVFCLFFYVGMLDMVFNGFPTVWLVCVFIFFDLLYNNYNAL